MFLSLMAVGNTEVTIVSTDLPRLLFRCVGNEIDKPQPRAMAALDALLFACLRLLRLAVLVATSLLAVV